MLWHCGEMAQTRVVRDRHALDPNDPDAAEVLCARIESISHLHAFVAEPGRRERIRHELAALADPDVRSGSPERPELFGVPVGVKDILAMAEGPTTAQSLVLDPAWGQGKDAPVVSRLKAGGAVITGKLSTMEFAVGFPDDTKPFPLPYNPWGPGTWPGGSSSGSGNGVAAGMFLAAIGTDTGGSIRIPAAFCGTSGLMPTYGRVPKSGCVPLGYPCSVSGQVAALLRAVADGGREASA